MLSLILLSLISARSYRLSAYYFNYCKSRRKDESQDSRRCSSKTCSRRKYLMLKLLERVLFYHYLSFTPTSDCLQLCQCKCCRFSRCRNFTVTYHCMYQTATQQPFCFFQIPKKGKSETKTPRGFRRVEPRLLR